MHPVISTIKYVPDMTLLQMQTILYHNSSGHDAFTGNLKQKEVHRAITLHPVKQHQHMYRVHNYMKVSKDSLITLNN
jgi:chondroitin sulfate synthase